MTNMTTGQYHAVLALILILAGLSIAVARLTVYGIARSVGWQTRPERRTHRG